MGVYVCIKQDIPFSHSLSFVCVSYAGVISFFLVVVPVATVRPRLGIIGFVELLVVFLFQPVCGGRRGDDGDIRPRWWK